jgi:hypothetical protein
MEGKEKIIPKDENLISYCGFYCGTCPTYTGGKCEGCRGNSPLCAVGYHKCKVRPCCIENAYFSCADCEKYITVKSCKEYNPLSIKFGEYISCTSRQKSIEMIREKGVTAFIEYMVSKEWVTMKTKDNFLNAKLGKKKG